MAILERLVDVFLAATLLIIVVPVLIYLYTKIVVVSFYRAKEVLKQRQERKHEDSQGSNRPS